MSKGVGMNDMTVNAGQFPHKRFERYSKLYICESTDRSLE